MTHPLDRVYRFETAAQWGAGDALGLRRIGAAGLSTPGSLRAARLGGTSAADANAILARDTGGRVLWLLADGRLQRLSDGLPVTVAVLPPDAARGAVRLIWGQRTGWLVTGDGGLARIDSASGSETGRFEAEGWHIADAIADRCDGVIAVETRGDLFRLRRIRDDGEVHPDRPEHPLSGSIRAARDLHDGAATLVITEPDGHWRVVSMPPDGSLPETPVHRTDPRPAAGGPVALSSDGRLTLVTPDRRAVFPVAEGRGEPVTQPEPGCTFGEITDLIATREGLVAATTEGLFALTFEDTETPPRRGLWLSPVLRSPLAERSGWQRADLTAHLPEGAELRISARGFDTATAAGEARDAVLAGPLNHAEALAWEPEPPTRHPGRGAVAQYRHYLGEIGAEYLVLRVEITVPAGRGPARLDRFRVLYPNRSLIEMLPAIYRDGGRSEKQMRRALAGVQAMIDEIDDRISEGAARIDPETADDQWTGFLMHWLGHGALARLRPADRRAVLTALPALMQARGTRAALARLLEILAPGAWAIEDAAEGPATWLLSAPDDPAGPRLGDATRIGHTAPKPFRAGACTRLGDHALGTGCGGEAESAGCGARVVVRLFGTSVVARLRPFLDPIARLFAPAHTRLDWKLGDHRPGPGLGAVGLGAITLDSGGSRALGAWPLPVSDPTDPSDSAPVLDRAVLDGTLTLA
ncbi:hypothetical protein HKCCE3408_14625 [Rhodobacterales bacterium HKCCE3408]|nr:hypothetical protein [Rhodobacterales bacterium HKCCE3408]